MSSICSSRGCLSSIIHYYQMPFNINQSLNNSFHCSKFINSLLCCTVATFCMLLFHIPLYQIFLSHPRQTCPFMQCTLFNLSKTHNKSMRYFVKIFIRYHMLLLLM
uniref:Uncharacterized protein n=1 Tax=Opuntia streptacantha TaxID=393608 RepID=A0A7C8ZLL2_OPUST